ncbi:MAG: hypothetical protein ACOX2O_02860 [Bdellovibrionota bacterium]|jgi:hypothetical protein
MGGQLNDRKQARAETAGTITADGMRRADRGAAAAETAAERVEQSLMKMAKLGANATVSASPVTAEEREKWAYRFADPLEGKKYDKNISAKGDAELEEVNPTNISIASTDPSLALGAEKENPLALEGASFFNLSTDDNGANEATAEILEFVTGNYNDVNLSVDSLEGHDRVLNDIRKEINDFQVNTILKDAGLYISQELAKNFFGADLVEAYQCVCNTGILNREAKDLCLKVVVPRVFKELMNKGLSYSCSPLVAGALGGIVSVGENYVAKAIANRELGGATSAPSYAVNAG